MIYSNKFACKPTVKILEKAEEIAEGKSFEIC